MSKRPSKGFTLTDLNDTLFECMDNLMNAETDEELERELKRAKAVSDVATNVIDSAQVTASVYKTMVTQVNGKTTVPAILQIETGDKN